MHFLIYRTNSEFLLDVNVYKIISFWKFSLAEGIAYANLYAIVYYKNIAYTN